MQKPPVSAKKAKARRLPGQSSSLLTVFRSRMPLEYGAKKRQWTLLLRTPYVSSRDSRLMRKRKRKSLFARETGADEQRRRPVSDKRML
jgi:hypothetical protein